MFNQACRAGWGGTAAGHQPQSCSRHEATSRLAEAVYPVYCAAYATHKASWRTMSTIWRVRTILRPSLPKTSSATPRSVRTLRPFLSVCICSSKKAAEPCRSQFSGPHSAAELDMVWLATERCTQLAVGRTHTCSRWAAVQAVESAVPENAQQSSPLALYYMHGPASASRKAE